MGKMTVLRINADKNRNRTVARQILRGSFACRQFAIKCNRVFKINNDRIGTAGGCLGKSVWPVTRNEKEGAQFHALIMPLVGRYGNLCLFQQRGTFRLANKFVTLIEASVQERHNTRVWPRFAFLERNNFSFRA